MSTLLLRFVAPLQAWGTSSRFTSRQTDRYPSKSGIVGLLAAAQGRRRVESIEDLAALKVGVRIDQPGSLLRDFQTARSADSRTSMPLSGRFYLQDAVFVAAVEGEKTLLQALYSALQSPIFPVYFGRKSCVPAAPLLIDLVDQPLLEGLKAVPWQASKRYQRTRKRPQERLEIVIDAIGDPDEFTPDFPVSFDSTQRQYALRPVHFSEVLIDNPMNKVVAAPVSRLGVVDHDPMGGLE
ncbi:type I-E CRISPR-associated protein Cas5/CasD [Jonesiaceae bacterium BS-20]|uniref:Type I-E CRISPR-associated protein Cas5/CasD n=1 Tax=Jonesiaceae bacterium BS-20 TaxID=3120821 RepID=A0AAU7DWX7_9MICO